MQDDKFTYDVQNRRIGKNTLSGGQSWTSYSGQNPLEDFNGSGSLQYQYLYGPGLDFLLGRADNSARVRWYLTDKLGSVREDVNNAGTVLDSITYDTYGNILAETAPSSGDRFKYTSREWDSEIGQYFYRARYYSPTDGRFESEDPVGFGGRDTDLYRYVHNEPINLTDPTGEQEGEALNLVYDGIIEYFGHLTENLVTKLIVKQWIKEDIQGQQPDGAGASKWANGEFIHDSSTLAEKMIKDISKKEKDWAAEIKAKGYMSPTFSYNWCVSWYVLDYRINPRSGDVRYALKAMIDVTAVKKNRAIFKHLDTKYFGGKYNIEDVKTAAFLQQGFRPNRLCKPN